MATQLQTSLDRAADAAFSRMRDLHERIEASSTDSEIASLEEQFDAAERDHQQAQNALDRCGWMPAAVAGTAGMGGAKAGLLAHAFARSGLTNTMRSGGAGGSFSMNEVGGLGQALTPFEYRTQFWDLLHPLAVGLQSGFTVVDTEHAELKIPALTSDPVAMWTPEATEITPTDPGGQFVNAIPRKLAALVLASNELGR
ncbi:MAG: hypothetical protein ACR2KV_01395 [Solirubrobacteraceae bacterium]